MDEPQAAEAWAEVFSQVAAERRRVMVRRHRADLAEIISLEHLELLQEVLTRQEVEHQAAQIDGAS